MLEKLRYKVAIKLVKIAEYYIDKGGYENIMKAVRYFKLSLKIVPVSSFYKRKIVVPIRETFECKN